MAAKRPSIYKNIHAKAGKKEACYTDLRNIYTSGEGNYVAASSTYFSVGKTGGGGPVLVHPLGTPGRIALNAPVVNVHRGKVLAMGWSPFNDNLLATAAEDCKVCLTAIPQDGVTANITQATQVLEGHSKKVGQLTFNPTSDNVLATGAYDRTVRTWDVETGENANTFEDINDNIYSLEWDFLGKTLASTSKDKLLRIFDPRQSEAAASVEAFDAMKASKCFWCDKEGLRVGAVGYTKKGKRALRIFDARTLGTAKPLFSWDIDQASSTFIPHFDFDTKMLYLAGKGEGSIMWFELDDTTSKLQKGALQYRNSTPSKGGCFIPKLGVDVMNCEVNRFLKLERNQIVPISLIVPRKVQGMFQEDIFPDTRGRTPSLSSAEYFKMGEPDIKYESMNPSERGDVQVKTVVVKKSYAELEKEVDTLKARVKELEAEIADLKS